MRKSSLLKNHELFDYALARYRTFTEKIVNAQRVVTSPEEKRDIAESVLLRICANWESFVGEHLIDCINRDPSKLEDFFSVSIPSNPSKDLCQALLYGESYRDFKSFGELKGFSKKILAENSNPFLAISDSHTKQIDEVYKIRNYLSHYSSVSKRSLQKMYQEKHEMQNFLEPGQFLLAYNAKRLWEYFGSFEGASNDMKNWYPSVGI